MHTLLLGHLAAECCRVLSVGLAGGFKVGLTEPSARGPFDPIPHGYCQVDVPQ
jgi:hypothetical protein